MLLRRESLEPPMSQLDQSRRFDHQPATSGLPQQTDILRAGGHVSKVPTPVIHPIVDILRIGRANASRVDRVSQPSVLISPRVVRNSKRDCMADRSI